MPHCCVPLCLNRSESKTETKLSFYRFPPKDKDKKRWLQLIRRDGFTPSPCSRVCSWHFPNGKAAGPSRFAWNEGKTFPGHLSLPHKKRKTVPLPPSGEEGTNELELQNSDIATAEPPSTSDNPTAETPSTSDNPTADTPSTSDNPTADTPSTSDNPTADTPNTSDNPTADTPGTSDNPTADTPSTSDNPTADTPRTSDNPFNSVALLEIEVDMLRRENEKLKRELEKQKQTFSFSQISSNRVKVKYFTGLPDVATVLVLEALLSKFELQYHSNWTVQSMPLVDQLLLTLMKLKLNSGHEDLATRFNCSTATVTNIFITIVSALYDILYVGMLENNIPSIEKNQASLPECFRPFPNCRIVLDCTELAVSRTERLDKQNHLWSQYKKRTTHKALIGVAPNGVITFVSDYYGGSASDKAITLDSGVLNHLCPGDMVMADKGFTIRDILPEGVSLNIPSFLVNGQFTQEEVKKNKLISSARIHVERSIQRLKLFNILDNIPYQFTKNINKILKVCACLTNLQTPILREIA